MNFSKLLLAVLVSLSIFSCDKDDPETINEVEVFSNVTLHLTSEDGTEEVEFHWHDENGNLNAEESEKELGSLSRNTTYSAVLSFNEEDEHDDEAKVEEVGKPTAANELDQLTSDDEDEDGHVHGDDVDAEIKEEDEDHQIFYSHDDVTGLTVVYLNNDDDNDLNGNPLGLKTTFITDDNFNGGNLTITLRHEPNKFADGVSDGDITNAGGETDIEITFNLGVIIAK